MRRVAVTGLGVLAPNGCGVRRFWDALTEGVRAVSRITAFDPAGHASQIAGQIDVLPALGSLAGSQLGGQDRFVRLALGASEQALDNSGLEVAAMDPRRAGACVANAIAGTRLMAEHFAELTDAGTAPLDLAEAHRFLHHAATFNTASATVSAAFGLQGPCVSVITGCTGGNDAVGFAAGAIRRGEADVMLAGAAEAPITPLVLACFDVIGALSRRNHDPEAASCPFDRGRDGFVLGEGAGVLVLEEWEHARRRGAHVYAEVSGYGTTCNAHHMTDLAPDGTALARSIDLALADAGCPTECLGYVKAHGSSTRQNDVCETNAIKRALGYDAYRVPVSSIKSMVGHALAAANAIELVACALVLEHQVIPPTMNFSERDPDCDLDYVPNAAREGRVEALASLSSGFGGIHSTVVLEGRGSRERRHAA
jgi:3-oxoacyl-(acyl-carrier-protein) synthase